MILAGMVLLCCTCICGIFYVQRRNKREREEQEKKSREAQKRAEFYRDLEEEENAKAQAKQASM
jgi:uncharacterized membrane protein YciS (DUF1049 family)